MIDYNSIGSFNFIFVFYVRCFFFLLSRIGLLSPFDIDSIAFLLVFSLEKENWIWIIWPGTVFSQWKLALFPFRGWQIKRHFGDWTLAVILLDFCVSRIPRKFAFSLRFFLPNNFFFFNLRKNWKRRRFSQFFHSTQKLPKRKKKIFSQSLSIFPKFTPKNSIFNNKKIIISLANKEKKNTYRTSLDVLQKFHSGTKRA